MSEDFNWNAFPGYEFKKLEDGLYHNLYMGEDVGFGGYVFSKPGMYEDLVTFDVQGEHPHSILALHYLGEYEKNYSDMINARAAIKHKDYELAKTFFDGKLAPYLTNPDDAKGLSKALKLAQNQLYGITFASYDLPSVDPRNVNNIIALRGALFMIKLRHEVEDRGFVVTHCKTDSIKVVKPSKEISDFIFDFGHKYGYDFEIEHTWKKLCLIDRAQFIGMHNDDDPESPGAWDAVGKKFQVPYVYKSLFTHEPIIFDDMCETFNVKTGSSLHLVFNEGTNKEVDKFIGRVGQFTPMLPGHGAYLYRVKEGKRYAATGTTNKKTKKKYEWLESDTVLDQHLEDYIDRSFYIDKCNEAIDLIKSYGDYDRFVDSEL